MSNRVYIGHLASRATDRDVEHFFRSFGRIRDVVLKNGFGFVEFEDSRDADDAVYELNGRELLGERVVVELSRRGGPYAGGGGGYGGGGGGHGGFRGGGAGAYGIGMNRMRSSRYGPPIQTRYRMLVTNLSTRCSWQEEWLWRRMRKMMRRGGSVGLSKMVDLKDLMRNAGEVSYADAHKKVRNEAVVCFSSHEDLRRAIDRYQGKDINGRRIKLVDDSEGYAGRRSRSRSHRSRSRSRSPRSRTRSPPSRSRSRTASQNAENGRSQSRSRSRSRSPTPSRSRSPNEEK
uniref:RRM domain-containing protein n=1 Tax=Globodera rostochiensis TaxID=31243 RepID=A0A914GTQ0_GLORO